jgi:hypothetical protein
VNRSSVSQDEANGPNVDPQRDGSGTSIGPCATELDQLVSVEGVDPKVPKLALQHIQSRGLRPPWWFADCHHVFDVELNQFSELRQPGNPGTDRRFIAVDRKLRYTGPAQRLIPTQEGLSDVSRPFRRTCARHEPEGSFAMVGIPCAIRVRVASW